MIELARDAPRWRAKSVASQTLDAVQQGRYEVLAGDTGRRVRAALAADITEPYPTLIRAGAAAG